MPKPTLLFISDSLPYPVSDGKRQRSLALIRALAKVYSVDCLVLGPKPEALPPELLSMDSVGFEFLSMAKQPGWKKRIGLGYYPDVANQKRLADFLAKRSYSLVFCRYTAAARDLPELSNLIIDVDDDYRELMRSKIKGTSSWTRKWRYRQIYWANYPAYRKILRRASRLILVREQSFPFSYGVVPNLPFAACKRGLPELTEPLGKGILFVGKLSYAPNSEGITWFLKKVWPDFNRKQPDSTLTIISPHSPNVSLMALIGASSKVELVVDVPDLTPYYRSNRICIVPLFSGGGSSLKLAEALVYGREVVSSEFGARGFLDNATRDVLCIANSPGEWSSLLEEILQRDWDFGNFEAARAFFDLSRWEENLIQLVHEA